MGWLDRRTTDLHRQTTNECEEVFAITNVISSYSCHLLPKRNIILCRNEKAVTCLSIRKMLIMLLPGVCGDWYNWSSISFGWTSCDVCRQACKYELDQGICLQRLNSCHEFVLEIKSPFSILCLQILLWIEEQSLLTDIWKHTQMLQFENSRKSVFK